MPRIAKSFLDYRKIDPITNCWLFTGCKDGSGYGNIRYKGKMIKVHRLSMHLFKEFDLDNPSMILHLNVCPNKNCFNPIHLYVGTRANNLQDAIDKGSTIFGISNKIKTHCNKGHELKGDNLKKYGNKRICRECVKINNANRDRTKC